MKFFTTITVNLFTMIVYSSSSCRFMYVTKLCTRLLNVQITHKHSNVIHDVMILFNLVMNIRECPVCFWNELYMGSSNGRINLVHCWIITQYIVF